MALDIRCDTCVVKLDLLSAYQCKDCKAFLCRECYYGHDEEDTTGEW
jgi:NifB/MoaA-like Fe-S oxidoreductase